MKVATGKVVAGRIVVEGEPLREGSVVTVLAPEDEAVFELTPEAEEALMVAIAEADRGEIVSDEDVLRDIGRSD